MADMENSQAIMGALGYPMALPQGVTGPYTTNKTQVQRVQYDPVKVQALMDALKSPKTPKSVWESMANAVAQTPDAQSFKGGFGEEIINPWGAVFTPFIKGIANTYGDYLANKREKADSAREDAIKAAQVAFDADKKVVTDTTDQQYFKVNDPNAGGNMAYRFEPERINELKELNDKAGRWATEWGKGVSDILSSDQSKAYNEFEGKAKQYVQDQLKKIYGAQMTEAEGERFFKSMGLSPYLAPDLRWKLVESALDDLARKNNTTIKPQNTAIDDFMKGTK